MACLRCPSTSSIAEGIRADPADLLEVQRAPLPPAGGVHTGLHQRPPRAQDPHPDFECLGLADGVVDDVDGAGVGHRQTLQRLAQPATAPGDELFDDGQARFVRKHFRSPEPAGQLGLGGEARHHRDGHIGIQRPQDRDRAQPQRAGPVDQRPRPSGAAGGG